jgi:GH15 family glucan-1,4-alpha-glucosidase
VICLPAADGIIQGTMDHGVAYSLGWVNHWAICGLREAAFAARVLGKDADALAYRTEADDLQAALMHFAERTPDFFEYERTVNSLLWPTRAWEAAVCQAEQGFNAWYQHNREEDGQFKPEPYWLNFESSQTHNALLFGQRQRAWQVVDYRMRHQDLPGLYGWHACSFSRLSHLVW